MPHRKSLPSCASAFRQRLKSFILIIQVISRKLHISASSGPEHVLVNLEERAVVGVVGAFFVIRGADIGINARHRLGINREVLRAELMDMLKKEIAVYALPREIRFRDSLPKTLVGKIDYLALKAEE